MPYLIVIAVMRYFLHVLDIR